MLELKKLPEKEQNESGIIRWMRFLGAKSRKEFEKMAKEDTYIDEAYEMLKEHIAYVHIKDCIHAKGVVPAGFGDGHLKEILTDLYRSGYHGFLSLEPHLGGFDLPDEKACGKLVISFADGAPRKFAFAHKALTDLLSDIEK